MVAYRLQTLLEIRERAEEEAKKAFSEASQALAREQKKQRQMEESLEQRQKERKAKIAEYMAEVMSKGSGVGGLGNLSRYEARLKDEEAQLALAIEQQKDVVIEAEQWVEVKRKEMAHAAMEKKAIEKHKEKWAKAVRAERDMREELSQEEIGNALHLARQRE